MSGRVPCSPDFRFWEKVDKSGGADSCWIWLGAKSSGYGVFRLNNVMDSSHRVVWRLTHGPIPYGAWVLHACDQKLCVNPKHLRLGTPKDNTQDMLSKNRGRWKTKPAYCKNGHKFDTGNTYTSPSGTRRCRACNRERDKKYYYGNKT